MNQAEIQGGCLCGAVRYLARGKPTASMICHCRSCRLGAGAPIVAWLTFSASRFSFIAGRPSEFRSTPPVARTFCPTCGTCLTYVHAGRATEVDVATATLDDPEQFPPTYHAWVADGVRWIRLGDGLPVFARDGQ